MGARSRWLPPGEVSAVVGEPPLQSTILTPQVGHIRRTPRGGMPWDGGEGMVCGSCRHLLMLSWRGARRGTVHTREYVDVAYWA